MLPAPAPAVHFNNDTTDNEEMLHNLGVKKYFLHTCNKMIRYTVYMSERSADRPPCGTVSRLYVLERI